MGRRKAFTPNSPPPNSELYLNKRTKASKDGLIFCRCGCQKKVSLPTQRVHLNQGGPLRMRRGRSASSLPASDAIIDLTADNSDFDTQTMEGLEAQSNSGEEESVSKAECGERGEETEEEDKPEDEDPNSLWSDSSTLDPYLVYLAIWSDEVRYEGKFDCYLS